MDVDVFWRPLETAFWIRPLDLIVLSAAWPVVLRSRTTRTLRGVILVGLGEMAFIAVGVAGESIALVVRAALLLLVLAGTFWCPWSLSGLDRADIQYHGSLVRIVDPTRRATRRWRVDLDGARVAVARACVDLEAQQPPGPQWERLHSLLLDYYRAMVLNYDRGGGEAAPGYREAAELLTLIKVEWQRAWQAVTPFRR